MPELTNCEFCGRDTRNRSRICGRCVKGVSLHTQAAIEAELEYDPEAEENPIVRAMNFLHHNTES